MSKAVRPASFEEFLGAPARLSEREGTRDGNSGSEASAPVAGPSPAHGMKRPGVSSQKVKIGLTMDQSLIDAVDDYIYLARKQGRRLKKNDVYEAALRQFLKTEGMDVR